MQLEHLKVKSLLSALTFLILVLNVGSVLRLCGDELPTALDDVCHMGNFKGFNSKLKRALDSPELIENGFALQSRNVNDGRSDLLASNDDRAMLRRLFNLSGRTNRVLYTRQRRFGVYDECCLKPCTYGELINYCRT